MVSAPFGPTPSRGPMSIPSRSFDLDRIIGRDCGRWNPLLASLPACGGLRLARTRNLPETDLPWPIPSHLQAEDVEKVTEKVENLEGKPP